MGKVSCGLHSPYSVFLVRICRLFELLTRFIHKMLVAMFAVPGGVYMLNSVFFLNAEVFGVSDSLGEKISVGNVELILLRTGPRLAYHGHQVHPSTLEVWKARVWLPEI